MQKLKGQYSDLLMHFHEFQEACEGDFKRDRPNRGCRTSDIPSLVMSHTPKTLCPTFQVMQLDSILGPSLADKRPYISNSTVQDCNDISTWQHTRDLSSDTGLILAHVEG